MKSLGVKKPGGHKGEHSVPLVIMIPKGDDMSTLREAIKRGRSKFLSGLMLGQSVTNERLIDALIHADYRPKSAVDVLDAVKVGKIIAHLRDQKVKTSATEAEIKVVKTCLWASVNTHSTNSILAQSWAQGVYTVDGTPETGRKLRLIRAETVKKPSILRKKKVAEVPKLEGGV